MKDDEQNLVILVNMATCLTAVFPLCPASDFVDSVTATVQAALVDLNVDAAAIARECDALGGLQLKRLSRSEFGEVLRYVEYMCGIEVMYHSDLRRVQRNLNALPHQRVDSGVPAAEVRALFESGGERSLH